MEQLMRTGNEAMQQGKLIELAMLMKKVTIKLSREQFATLARIMSIYIADITLIELGDKAIVYELYKMYDSTVRKKALSFQQTIKISLTMTQCWALRTMFEDVSFMNLPYESTLGRYIISEIDHQTV